MEFLYSYGIPKYFIEDFKYIKKNKFFLGFKIYSTIVIVKEVNFHV